MATGALSTLRIKATLDGAQAVAASKALQSQLNRTFVQQKAAAQLSGAVAALTNSMATLAAGAARLSRAQILVAKASAVATRALVVMRGAAIAVGKVFLVAIPLAIAAVTVKMISLNRTAEKALTEVAALADFTTKEIEEMRKGTERLASTFGVSFEKISKARFDVVSSGFASVAEQQTILAGAFTLGAANATDMTVATSTLTGVLAAFGRDASQTNRTMDELTAIAQNSKTNLEGLSSALTLVAPTANDAGFGLSEVGGALDVMTLAGISAEESATALNSGLRTLSNPATRGAIEAAGVAVRDLETGAIRPLADIIDDLGKQAPDALKALIPDIRAQRAFSVLTRNAELFRDKVAIIESEDSVGKTAEAAAKATATLDFQLKRLGETINNRIRQLNVFGTSLTDLVREIADFLGGDSDIVKLQKQRGELLDREQTLIQRKLAFSKDSFLQEGFDKELAANREHQKNLAKQIFDLRPTGPQGPQVPAGFVPTGANVPDAPAEIATVVTDAQKKANTERINLERSFQIELAQLRGEDGLAFDLELDRRLTELASQGRTAIEIEAFKNAAITEQAAAQFEAELALVMKAKEIEDGIKAESPEGGFFTGLFGAAAEGAEKLEKAGGAIQAFGEQAFGVFSGGLANSITEVFQALGSGKPISGKALLGSLLQSIGQAAISMGTFAILVGTVVALGGTTLAAAFGVKDVSGGALIASGAALVAFGAATSAAGAALSKQKGGTGAAAGAAAGSPGGIRAAGGGGGLGRQEEGRNVSVTILGSIIGNEAFVEDDLIPAIERASGRGVGNLQLSPEAA